MTPGHTGEASDDADMADICPVQCESGIGNGHVGQTFTQVAEVDQSEQSS